MKEDISTMCPICDQKAQMISYHLVDSEEDFLLNKYRKAHINDANVFFITCPICGKFEIFPINTRIQANPDFEQIKDQAYLLSGFCRNHIGSTKLVMEYDKINNIIQSQEKFKNIIEKMKLFLNYINNEVSFFEEMISVHPRKDFSLFYCKNDREFINLLQFLKESGYVKIERLHMDQTRITITISGMKFIDKKNPLSKQIFVAMKFKEVDGIKLPEIYDKLRENINKNTGYNLLWLNMDYNEPFVEKICDQIIGEIKQSRFLIADITHENPNVMYEAGFAHGYGIEVMFACEKKKFHEMGEDLPFDTRQYNHFTWTVDNLEDFQNRIVAFIRARY